MHTSPRTTAHAAAIHAAGDMCAHAAPGHDLHPIQRRLAAATPSRWVDAIAGDVTDDGWLEIRPLDGSPASRVWHHEHLADIVHPGEPVALHGRYHVLVAAAGWLNVAAARALAD